jgi:hypothetical protein
MWDADRNGSLTPWDVLPQSNKNVHWACDQGPDHRWRAAVYMAKSCPFCANRRVSVTNSMSAVRPDMAAMWDAAKNGGASPAGVIATTTKRLHWRCSVGHEFVMRADILARRATLCWTCDGTLARSTRGSLSDDAPLHAALWHPTRNGDLTPDKVSTASRRRVWWLCPAEHEWEGVIADRTKTAGCPWCTRALPSPEYNFTTEAPHAGSMWHPTLNGDRLATDVLPRSSAKAWFACEQGHAFKGVVGLVAAQRWGCDQCSVRSESKVEVALYDALAAHYSVAPRNTRIKTPGKNGRPRTPDIILSGHRVIVEFDGGWWHRQMLDRDTAAFAEYASHGYRLIRIREEGLPLIGEWDLTVPARRRPVDAPDLARRVLDHLNALGILPDAR